MSDRDMSIKKTLIAILFKILVSNKNSLPILYSNIIEYNRIGRHSFR